MMPQVDLTRAQTGGAPLVPGVPLFFARQDMLSPGRVTLNAGVVPVGGVRSGAVDYCDIAFAPVESWRAPTDAELAIICPDQRNPDLDDTGFVGLLDLPPELIAPLHEQLADAKTEDDLLRTAAQERFAADMFRCVAELWPYCASPNDLEAIGFNLNIPGLPTTAMDRTEWRRMGMHLDSWREPKDDAPRRNRISINVGTEPRYFLYMNRPIQALETERISGERRCKRGNKFMAADPSYPVIRLPD